MKKILLLICVLTCFSSFSQRRQKVYKYYLGEFNFVREQYNCYRANNALKQTQIAAYNKYRKPVIMLKTGQCDDLADSLSLHILSSIELTKRKKGFSISGKLNYCNQIAAKINETSNARFTQSAHCFAYKSHPHIRYIKINIRPKKYIADLKDYVADPRKHLIKLRK